MAKRRHVIDPRVEIGRVHLRVSDLARAVQFYAGVLGFEMRQPAGQAAVWLGAGGDRRHIRLAGPEEVVPGPVERPVGPAPFAIRYPTRAALADALARVSAAGIPVDGSHADGASEALFLRDPDGYALELYYERPRGEWSPEGESADGTPVDLASLRAETAPTGDAPPHGAPAPPAQPMSELMRARLQDMRAGLLGLHKVLLEDARIAYELDRGSVGSNASFLQLVINDPWFAWLRPLSELVVRIDETLHPDAGALESDGVMLLEQVAQRLVPDDSRGGFTARYREALQRQPAVVLAHAEVRRLLKQPK